MHSAAFPRYHPSADRRVVFRVVKQMPRRKIDFPSFVDIYIQLHAYAYKHNIFCVDTQRLRIIYTSVIILVLQPYYILWAIYTAVLAPPAESFRKTGFRVYYIIHLRCSSILVFKVHRFTFTLIQTMILFVQSFFIHAGKPVYLPSHL